MDGLVLRKDRASDEHPPRIDEYHCIRKKFHTAVRSVGVLFLYAGR